MNSSISEKNNEISIFIFKFTKNTNATLHLSILFIIYYYQHDDRINNPKVNVFKQIEIQSKPHLHSYFFTSSS